MHFGKNVESKLVQTLDGVLLDDSFIRSTNFSDNWSLAQSHFHDQSYLEAHLWRIIIRSCGRAE